MPSSGPCSWNQRASRQLFSPWGQNISCMLIFTGQWWPHRAASVLAHPQKTGISTLPLADVVLVSLLYKCYFRFIQNDRPRPVSAAHR